MVPDISNAEVCATFVVGTTCKGLVRELGRAKPRTTAALLEIATDYASGEDAVDAVFNKRSTAGEDAPGDVEPGTSSRPAKRKKKTNRRRRDGEDELVAAAEQKGGKAPAKEPSNAFEKAWNAPCPNHDGPVRHLLKDCNTLRKFQSMEREKRKKTNPPAGQEDDDNPDPFPEPN